MNTFYTLGKTNNTTMSETTGLYPPVVTGEQARYEEVRHIIFDKGVWFSVLALQFHGRVL